MGDIEGSDSSIAATGANGHSNVRNPSSSCRCIDPKEEDDLRIVNAALDVSLRTRSDATDLRKMMVADSDHDAARQVIRSNTQIASTEAGISASPAGFLQLPPELMDTVLGYLSPEDLSIAGQVCKKIHAHACTDLHWQRHVWLNLPGNPITSPYPFKTFRELYACHDPYWFIPKHKLWFSDRGLTGQIMVAQYDQRRGVIEGYQLLAIRDRDGSEPWLADNEVHIHHFEPDVRLHRDKAVIQFNPDSIGKLTQSPASSSKLIPRRQFYAERPMLVRHGSDKRYSNIILARPLTEAMLEEINVAEFPYGYVWPPPAVPARHRVGAKAAGILPISSHRFTKATSDDWKPTSRSETSDQVFRVRQWMEMGPPTLGVHLGEEIATYSTLDPALYTPTPERPYRGIWVGDYSGHGCEFLLLNQPELEGEEDAKKPLERNQDETDAEFETRFLHEKVYKGRLEAIKLTGDPNVPRGEYTFITEDIGEAGYVGVAQDPPFEGARVVKSYGHIASMGFLNDKYMESQLILISHNRLAQFWVGFGHISFFERVDIDRFLVP
ncbi:F-box domain-containing protein [Xylariales sp. AK1849]|nr:F-box domain-containing protein [Xylariales sp. AK1849]